MLPSAEAPLRVITQRSAFRLIDRVDRVVVAGGTVQDILVDAQVPAGCECAVYVDAERVGPDEWAVRRPRPGQMVYVRALAAGGGGGRGGGKGAGGIIAAIALIALTVLTAGAAAPLLGLGTATLEVAATGAIVEGFVASTAGLIANAIGSAVVNVGGRLLINALMPPPGVGKGPAGPATVIAPVTGIQNRANPYGIVPRCYGTNRMYPVVAAEPIVESSGAVTRFRQLFTFGRGPLDIKDLKIGTSPIFSAGRVISYTEVMEGDGDFEDVSVEIRRGTASDAPITLYAKDEHTDAEQVELRGHKGASGSGLDITPGEPEDRHKVVRRTGVDADEITVEIAFPEGLYLASPTRGTKSVEIRLRIRARQVAPTPGDWVVIPNKKGSQTHTIEKAITSLVRYEHNWTPPARGQYDVEILRLTPKSGDENRHDKTYWTTLRTIRSSPPVLATGMCLVAIKIRATGQFSGVVDELSALATSRLPAWNGTTWAESATSNAAAIMRDLLQGPGLRRPCSDSMLDLPTLQACAAAWDIEHRECNIVFEDSGTVHERIRAVLATARASFSMPDGKYSIVRDIEQTTPVQTFTPANSWGFKATKTFAEVPHALVVRYVDVARDGQEVTQYVYRDGYSELGGGGTVAASTFEEMSFPGYTSPFQVWIDARYHLAVALLRTQTFELSTDFEWLRCIRGDLVTVQNDAMGVGLAAPRVKVVRLNGGGDCIGVDFAEVLTMETGKTYGLTIRRKTLARIVRPLTTAVGSSASVTFVTAIPAASPHPEVGDLCVFGETDNVELRCLVKSIEPTENEAARLTLVPEAPGVYAADQVTPPSWATKVVGGEVAEGSRVPTDELPPPVVVAVNSSSGSGASGGTKPKPAANGAGIGDDTGGGKVVITVNPPPKHRKPRK